MLNMFRTLIHPSSGACDFSVVSPHWSCVLVWCVLEFRCGWVGVVSVWQASACYMDTTDTIEKSQPPDDGCINVQNMLSIEEVKWNLITSDIRLVSYSSTSLSPCLQESTTAPYSDPNESSSYLHMLMLSINVFIIQSCTTHSHFCSVATFGPTSRSSSDLHICLEL